MFKVGITGGIGSGKTTVCRVFEVLGIPVFYADPAAREVMNTDPVLITGVQEAFGDEAYQEGILNRKFLANIVFNDERELAKLNALVHPAVFRAFDAWVSEQHGVPYVLKEAALLFESGSDKLCDETVLVIAPRDLKIQRVRNRDKITEAEVLKRMDKQFSDEKKAKLASFLVRNDEKELLIPQVLKLHEQFLSLAQG
ncbi:MAG: dephospho-CoA kinase [Sphingobacteriaceae bacterium]|jgi:dephospho-CoA kinase|nr:dephospho-CoA kinase [Sphingobacteriaceae bacterium]